MSNSSDIEECTCSECPQTFECSREQPLQNSKPRLDYDIEHLLKTSSIDHGPDNMWTFFAKLRVFFCNLEQIGICMTRNGCDDQCSNLEFRFSHRQLEDKVIVEFSCDGCGYSEYFNFDQQHLRQSPKEITKANSF